MMSARKRAGWSRVMLGVAATVAMAAVLAATASGGTLVQQGPKLIANDETGAALFGTSVAVSADGNTALVGGWQDGGTGAAWVFTRTGSTWTQQGPKLTPDDATRGAQFGVSVALSADGNTALIGGQSDGNSAGAAWAFTRSGSTWTQQGPKLTASDEAGQGNFGTSVSLSGDGNTALIGGPGDDNYLGAAWVFTRSGSTWTQQGGKLTGNDENPAASVLFGDAVSLSGDGNTALIGGERDSNFVGAAWVFSRSGSAWTQAGPKLTPDDAAGHSTFGFGVALSSDGNTALIGGPGDNDSRGAAWAFTRTGSAWAQQGPKVTPSDETAANGSGYFGQAVALAANGDTALIGASQDGYDGTDLSSLRGAAWTFSRTAGTWTQHGAKLSASDETGGAAFGGSVSLAADGNTAVIGGPFDNASTGAAWAFALNLPTTADQCKGGGWATYGVFKNQGDCVSYIASKGKNPPAG